MALRIKDNVNLKELEKFGFEYVDKYKEYMKFDYDKLLEMSVKVSDRILYFYCGWDTIFDLIKADLVEKVEK